MSINVKLSAAIALLFHAVILFVDNTAVVCQRGTNAVITNRNGYD